MRHLCRNLLTIARKDKKQINWIYYMSICNYEMCSHLTKKDDIVM